MHRGAAGPVSLRQQSGLIGFGADQKDFTGKRVADRPFPVGTGADVPVLPLIEYLQGSVV